MSKRTVICTYIQKVKKLVLVWKFKSVNFVFGRLVDSDSSFEFNYNSLFLTKNYQIQNHIHSYTYAKNPY